MEGGLWILSGAAWVAAGLFAAQWARRDSIRSYGEDIMGVSFYVASLAFGPIALVAQAIHQRWGK